MVFADEQFAGKGQQGATWITEPGQNIITSILLKPAFLLPKHIFYLNKAIALAVHNFLAEHAEVRIKWPNDIYVQQKKIAGILIENTLNASAVQQSVVGIGININQDAFPEGLEQATSLNQITGIRYSLPVLLERLCAEIETQYLMLRSFQFKKIDDNYHQHLLGMGKENTFRIKGETVNGIIKGVNENGKLVVETEKNILELGVKEAEMVFNV